MQTYPAVLLALVLTVSTASFAAAQRPVDQDLRVELRTDRMSGVLRQGDPFRMDLRTSHDAHVAVIHIDTDGGLHFLYPESPGADGLARAGRSYPVPAGVRGGPRTVRGVPGVGYIYVIASPVPFDFRNFQQRGRLAWSFSRFGHAVRGDPFHVFELLTAYLLPDRRAVYAYDLFTYHVGDRHAVPRFACYDRRPDLGRGVWTGYYPPCDRIYGLLDSYPNYYDARRFQGDRQAFRGALREMEQRPVPPSERLRPGWTAPGERLRATPRPNPRERPTLERRPQRREATPARERRPAPDREREGAEPRRDTREAAPRERRETAPRAEPREERREAPPRAPRRPARERTPP